MMLSKIVKGVGVAALGLSLVVITADDASAQRRARKGSESAKRMEEFRKEASKGEQAAIAKAIEYISDVKGFKSVNLRDVVKSRLGEMERRSETRARKPERRKTNLHDPDTIERVAFERMAKETGELEAFVEAIEMIRAETNTDVKSNMLTIFGNIVFLKGTLLDAEITGQGVNVSRWADVAAGALAEGIRPEKEKAETDDLHKRAMMTVDNPEAVQKLAESTTVMVQETIKAQRRGERVPEDAIFAEGMKTVYEKLATQGRFEITLADGTRQVFENFKMFLEYLRREECI